MGCVNCWLNSAHAFVEAENGDVIIPIKHIHIYGHILGWCL